VTTTTRNKLLFLALLVIAIPLIVMLGTRDSFPPLLRHTWDLPDLPTPRGIDTLLDSFCVKLLENADRLELVSLDPRTKDAGGLAGIRILSSVVVKDRAQRRAITASIYESVNEGTDSGDCIASMPRHALIASHGSVELSLVMDFECCELDVHLKQRTILGSLSKSRRYPISATAQRTIEKYMMRAGMPILK
jgi:hypothetical protein